MLVLSQILKILTKAAAKPVKSPLQEIAEADFGDEESKSSQEEGRFTFVVKFEPGGK